MGLEPEAAYRTRALPMAGLSDRVKVRLVRVRREAVRITRHRALRHDRATPVARLRPRLAKAATEAGRNSRRWLRDRLLSRGGRASLADLRRWGRAGSADRLLMAPAVRVRMDVDTVRRIADTGPRDAADTAGRLVRR